MQRNTISIVSEVLKAAATGENEYIKMLAIMIDLRPRRSISQPPHKPNTPPHSAEIHSMRPDQRRTASLSAGTRSNSEIACPPMTGNMSNS